MCTVIINVPEPEQGPIRFIAIRDEDPQRPWLAPGQHWPEQFPGVTGIRDQRAGGAWLAFDESKRRAAVVLNRWDHSARDPKTLQTRGALALNAVVGILPDAAPKTAGFNLLSVGASQASVVSWDGIERQEYLIPPGTHMLAHDGLDDPKTERIKRWLGEFQDAGIVEQSGAPWWQNWALLLDRSAAISAPDAPEAIIRDNVFAQAASKSLLSCAVQLGENVAQLEFVELAEAGRWNQARYC